MARDTYKTIWQRVELQCPSVGQFRAKSWVNHAFRDIVEQRRWSWLVKRGQFVMPATYNTGTVSVTQGLPTVTGSGTTFTAAMIGRQFRIGDNSPLYTIQQFNSTTSLTLDADWGAADASAQTYEIYAAYVTPPDDFKSFIAVWDPANNWRLHLHRTQAEVNVWDAQRSNHGDAYFVVAADYTSSRVGSVDPVLQVRGTGPDPSVTSNSSYKGANDAIFTVEVTTGGASGVAVYQWKKDSGSYTTGVTTAATAQALQDGISIYWPTETYILGDTFIVRVASQDNPGTPRYELWPHKKSSYVYPYFYERDPDDLEDGGMVVPRSIRGDVILEKALHRAALWPGTETQPNPYYDLKLADRHRAEASRMIRELEISDDETYMADLSYIEEMRMAPLPFGDSKWLQSHAV